MQKPNKDKAPAAPVGQRGRFVGLVAVAKGLYQVVMLETVGEAVVKREVLSAGRGDMVNGKPVVGLQLATALADLNVGVTKRIREASDLWREPSDG